MDFGDLAVVRCALSGGIIFCVRGSEGEAMSEGLKANSQLVLLRLERVGQAMQNAHVVGSFHRRRVGGVNPSTWEILGFRTGFYPP
eukprot:6939918-Prymnesium_polylepis.1